MVVLPYLLTADQRIASIRLQVAVSAETMETDELRALLMSGLDAILDRHERDTLAQVAELRQWVTVALAVASLVSGLAGFILGRLS